MSKTIEQQVADVILQRDIAQLEIDGYTYRVGQPSVATLILVSEIISTLPVIEKVKSKDEIFYSVLHNARNYSRLGEIVAVLILGAKEVRKEQNRKRGWFSFLKGRKKTKVQRLGEQILENISSKQLYDLVVARFNGLDLGSFFAITTSLNEANILRPTKEVVQQPTQSGQPS